jgi:hypothetical protein
MCIAIIVALVVLIIIVISVVATKWSLLIWLFH